MEEAKNALESFAWAPMAFETPKQFDAAIKKYVSALDKLSTQARAAIVANAVTLLQVKPALPLRLWARRNQSG